MDYYGSMKPFRRLVPVATAVLLALVQPVQAQTPPAPEREAPEPPSLMDAQLFYEILLGEMNAKGADPATGFALLLDSARRTNDSRLYQRAMEIALQARSGDSALQAAQNWRLAQPDSREANRYVLQILLALNRVSDSIPALQRELTLASAAQKPQLLAAVPALYGRVGDRALAAKVVEEALDKELRDPEMAGDAWAAVGQLRLAAGQTPQALEAAQAGLKLQPASEAPVRLALQIMGPKSPAAESLVRGYLDRYPKKGEMRIAYARTLLDAQRYNDAQQQLTTVTDTQPELAEAWLILGALQTEDNQQAQAQKSLERYLGLAGTQPASEARQRGLSQAYLSLAQLAEKRQDYAAANTWLSKIDSPSLQTTARTRRAAILGAQGKVDEARALLQTLPTNTPAEARTRLMAEVQLLRSQKAYEAALQLLDSALQASPDDTDLMYDLAMMAEKLGRFEQMEKLLRDIMAQQPENQNAYNALGYSLADRGVRLDEAHQLVSKALELAPNDPFISDSLGWVEFKRGRLQEAIQILDKAFQSKPDPEIAAHLGEVLWVSGQRSRATAVWKQGVALSRDNETLQDTMRRFNVKP